MTPKEKAKELVGKYTTVLSIPLSKEFALLAVDEVLNALYSFSEKHKYYLEVKQEIEKL